MTTQPGISLAVVVLNWNAGNDTLACIARVRAWATLQPHIIIVDNASHDDSATQIQARFPDITLIRNAENLGFAGGSNRGMAAALQAGATHILLLNNDASVNAAAIGALHDAMAVDKHIGMIGPLLYRADTNTLISAGSRDPGRHFNTLDTTIPNTTLKEVDYVSGSVALLSSAMLAQVGLLDEAFFFNTEVADLCMRARKHGWRTVVHTRARAEHDLHRSSALRDTLYAYYIVRNRLLYVRKHLGLRVGWMALWGAYGLALATKLALANKPQQAMAVWLGTRDGLRGRFGGQNARVLAAIGATPP